MEVCEAMGEEEQMVCLLQFVEAGEVEGEEGEIVLVYVKDRGGDSESLLEATLGEEELGF